MFKSTRNDLLLARYRSLLNDVPVAVFTAISAVVIQMVALYDVVDWKWSVGLPMLRMLVATLLLAYCIWRLNDTPDVATVRFRLKAASIIMLVAGALSFNRNLYLFSLVDGWAQYYLVLHTTLYGFCFAFILNKIGPAAYIYNLLLIASAITCIFKGNLAYQYPLTALIVTFEVGILLAMRASSQVFDQWVNASYETNQLLDENRRLANQDALTHLPNRRQFFIHIEQHLHEARQAHTPFAIGIVDLDDFKPVNDAHGHQTGDLVLIEIANRLRTLQSETLQFYRLGGDEFAFILSAENLHARLKQLGEQIDHVSAPPMYLKQFEIYIHASVGACLYSSTADTAKTLYEQADLALYHVKRNGRGFMTTYTDALSRPPSSVQAV